MNIYRVWLNGWGYGAEYAVVLLAESMDEAIDHAFKYLGVMYPGDAREELGYRAALVGTADPEFVGGHPDVDDPWPCDDPRVVLLANAGG